MDNISLDKRQDKEELMLSNLIETIQLVDEYNKKAFINSYDGLNINEVHAIDYIGCTEYANVTKITAHLKITKGAVTKITQKLIRDGYIQPFQTEKNKKEKYFSLTSKGKTIFTKHKKVHNESIERDKMIFKHFNDDELDIIYNFLNVFKKDLKEKLK